VATIRVTPATRKEDDRLREELKNADLKKIVQLIKRVISLAKKSPKEKMKHG
jgi:hypothetical protein